MKKKYFNKRVQRRAKKNLMRQGGRKRMLSKRIGGILDASLIMENRNQHATGIDPKKKNSL